MSVLVTENKQNIVYTKGAPEKILKMCNFIYKNGKVIKMSKHEIDILKEKNKEFETQSLRVLALAYQKVDPSVSEIKNDNLVFLGFVGIEDAPREEVFEAIRQSKKSGIKVNAKFLTSAFNNGFSKPIDCLSILSKKCL